MTDFYMMITLAFNELITLSISLVSLRKTFRVLDFLFYMFSHVMNKYV